LRLVQTLRDYTYMCERSGMFRSGKICEGQCADCKIFTSQYKRLSQRVSAVVSNSRYVLDTHLRSGYFKDVPAHVIFNIANIDAQTIPNERDTQNQGRLTFGFLGRIVEEKGLEVVLKATQRLKKENWQLKIGGNGREDYLALLKNRFTDSRIEWL